MVGAVTVRTYKELKHDYSLIIQYDDNAVVIIDEEGNLKGTTFFWSIVWGKTLLQYFH